MLTWVISAISSLGKGFEKVRKSDLLPLILPFILLVLVGTLAYARLEDWTLVESLYATIITITTVGYGDFSPQTPSGRVFAIFFTLGSIGLAGYALSAVAAVMFEGQQAKSEQKRYKKRMKKISNLSKHVIVCGSGVLGTRATVEFRRRGVPFVLLEQDEERLKRTLLWLHDEYVSKRMAHYESLEEVDFSIEERMTIPELAEATGALYIVEDPTDEQQLRAAGIQRAYGVVAAMDDDRDNTTIILSARDMAKRLGNADCRIVSSASEELSIHTLYLAGADRVIAPNFNGGFTIASQMLDHDTAEFMEQVMFRSNDGMRFGDMSVSDHPEIIGQTTEHVRQQLAQLVVSIRRDGQFINAPGPDEVLQADDVLIVMGPQISH